MNPSKYKDHDQLLLSAAQILRKLASDMQESEAPPAVESDPVAEPAAPIEEPAAEPADPVVPEVPAEGAAPSVDFVCNGCGYVETLDNINAANKDAGATEADLIVEGDSVGCPKCQTGTMSAGVSSSADDPSVEKMAGINLREIAKSIRSKLPASVLSKAKSLNVPEVAHAMGKSLQEVVGKVVGVIRTMVQDPHIALLLDNDHDIAHAGKHPYGPQAKAGDIRTAYMTTHDLSLGTGEKVVMAHILRLLEDGVLDPHELNGPGAVDYIIRVLTGAGKTVSADPVSDLFDKQAGLLGNLGAKVKQALIGADKGIMEQVKKFLDTLDDASVDKLLAQLAAGSTHNHTASEAITKEASNLPSVKKAILGAALVLMLVKGVLAGEHLNKIDLESHMRGMVAQAHHVGGPTAELIGQIGEVAQSAQDKGFKGMKDNREKKDAAPATAPADTSNAPADTSNAPANDDPGIWVRQLTASVSVDMSKVARYL